MKYILVILLFIGNQFVLTAQYEIRAVNAGDGLIAVEMRETTGNAPVAGDFLVDLVFGLKWDPAYNVDLSNIITSNYEIEKSDTRKLKDGFHYQAFYADNQPLAIPVNWNAGWVEIMRISNTLDGDQLTGAFYICEPAFDITTKPDININLTAYHEPVINGFAAAVVLPVTLRAFTAKKVNNQGVLEWSTSTEVNADHFLVERSYDAQYWESIGKVQAAGTSSSLKEYELIDKTPTGNSSNKSVYYRLKIVDRDGAFEYSAIRVLDFEQDGNFDLLVYPNPAKDILFLERSSRSNTSIKIYSPAGKLLHTQQSSIPTNKVVINVSRFPNGTYILTDGDNQMVKFIKY